MVGVIPSQPLRVASEKDMSQEMRTPGVAVAFVDVNAYDEVPGCSVPGPLSISGLDSNATEDATANVTGAPELPEKVTGVPTCTTAFTAGLNDASSDAKSAWPLLKQITHGGVGTYPCAKPTGLTATNPSAANATSSVTRKENDLLDEPSIRIRRDDTDGLIEIDLPSDGQHRHARRLPPFTASVSLAAIGWRLLACASILLPVAVRRRTMIRLLPSASENEPVASTSVCSRASADLPS